MLGTAGICGLDSAPAAAAFVPEKTTIRLVRVPGICITPHYIAEDLLRAEGFNAVHYVDTQAGVEASGSGDERRITQVLLNLVGNAIKFTEPGEVRIQASASDAIFLVSVSDTGLGIA